MKRFIQLVMFAFACATHSQAADFRPASIYTVGANPDAVVAGDFNADGKPDLAVISEGSGTVTVLLGHGDGTFQAPKSFSTNGAPGAKPLALTAGDFNGDQKLDLAIFNGTSVALCLGRGDGTFQSPLPLGIAGANLLAVDVNVDGKLDLIAGDEVLLGNGNGSFQSPLKIAAVPVLSADFNGDGKPDVLDGAGIFLGNGDGTFQTSIPLDFPEACHQVFCPSHNLHFAPADFNGDGKLDLAVLDATRRCIDVCSPYSFVSNVLLGNGDGTFRPANMNGLAGFFLLTADFNGDGKMDLLAAPTVFAGSSTFQIALGNGQGGFAILPTHDVGSGPGVFLATDLNGDHLPDVVTTDYTEAAISVLLNKSPATGSDLSVRVDPSSANITVGSGDVNFTVTVLNQGPEDDSEITLTTTLPSAMTLVSARPSQGKCTGASIITCELGATADVSSTTVQFTLTPKASGILTTALHVTGAERDLNPANDSASFEVTAVVPDFALSSSVASLSMKRGEQVSETLAFSAQGGFSGKIALACTVSGPAPMPTCGITPTSVSPGNSATLTISAPGLSAALLPPSAYGSVAHLPWLALGIASVGLLVGLKKERRRLVWAAGLLAAVVILPAACGGGNSTHSSTLQPRNYSVTVSAVSGALQHSTTISVTVN
jgi:uncharacterized repeat protein (TIGR01451 family)